MASDPEAAEPGHCDATATAEAPPACLEALKLRAPKWKLQLACLLAVAQGWTSMECLLIYKTFASIMTGNMLLVLRDWISGDDRGYAVHLAVLASYAFGFVLYRGLTTLMGFYTSSTALGAVVALLLFAVDFVRAAGHLHSRFEVCFAATALGIVNATALVVHGITTHMVTITLQKLFMSIMDVAFRVGKRDAKYKAIRESGVLVGSFGTGAAIGAALYTRAGYTKWVFSSLAVTFFVLLVAHDYVFATELMVAKKEAAAAQQACVAAVAEGTRHSVAAVAEGTRHSVAVVAESTRPLRRQLRRQFGMRLTPFVDEIALNGERDANSTASAPPEDTESKAQV